MPLWVHRLPNRPVINTPIVSIALHRDGEPLMVPLERPVIVRHRLLVAEERTKPQCVYWNHSIGYAQPRSCC